MIAKNIKAQSFAGCVRYVMKKDAEALKAEGVMAISKEEYMQNMGIKDTQYIIVRHHDGDNEHVHIVYNRIDNRGKLISDKNDYKRNIATCKRLKDKYNLTYGANKFRVKREKLRGSERVKHDIYHAVREEIVKCRTMAELRERLTNRGIEMQYKFRRGSMDIQGLSFTKDNCTFKAIEAEWKKIDEEQKKTITVKGVRLSQQQQDDLYAGKRVWIDGMTMNSGAKRNGFAKLSQDGSRIQFMKRNIPSALGGVKLTIEQRLDLDDGKAIFMSGLVAQDKQVYDCYVKYSDEKQGCSFYRSNPDEPAQQQVQQQPQPQSQDHDQSGSFVSGGLGLLDLPPDDGGDDPDETAFRNRMQQQQKKKRGRRM